MSQIKEKRMTTAEAVKHVKAIKWDGSYLRMLEKAQARTLKSSLQIGEIWDMIQTEEQGERR